MRSGKISFGYRAQRDFGSFAASAMRPFEGSGRDQDRLDLGRITGSSTPLKLKIEKSDYRPEKKRIEVSVGESVRIIRELQGFSQNGLAKLSGIPQSTISAVENDRVNLGVERAKTLARVLNCHPAVLVFPGWEMESEHAA